MTVLAVALTIAFVVTLVGVWTACTWPLLQWTLAWLHRREAKALAELFGRDEETKP